MKEHRTSDSEVATRGAVGAAPGARAPPHGGTANEGDARLDGLRGTKEKAVDALRSVREGAVVAAEAVKDRAAEALQYGKQTLGLGGDSGGEGAGTEAQQGSDNTPPKVEFPVLCRLRQLAVLLIRTSPVRITRQRCGWVSGRGGLDS